MTPAEIQTIVTTGGYCLPPDSANLIVSNITTDGATLNFPNTTSFDVAYHKTSEPFSNATINLGVSSGGLLINGLDEFDSYEVYLREVCASNTTAWSNPVNFETLRNIGRIYVDLNANGSNNGTSWTNAYNHLNDALDLATSGEEIWVARGRYTPDTSDRNASFVINQDDIDLYGGFDGTETMISERDFRNNITMLSGDLDGNDDSIIDFTNTTKNENSYTVVLLDTHNSIIDGFTISHGYANGASTSTNSGAGVNFINQTGLITLRNCNITNNIAFESGAGVFAPFSSNVNTNKFSIESCEFSNNLSRGGSAVYIYTLNNTFGELEAENCLFSKNTAANRGSNLGYSGSSIWARAFGTNSLFATTVTNTTFTDNIDTGTFNGLTTLTEPR